MTYRSVEASDWIAAQPKSVGAVGKVAQAHSLSE